MKVSMSVFVDIGLICGLLSRNISHSVSKTKFKNTHGHAWSTRIMDQQSSGLLHFDCFSLWTFHQHRRAQFRRRENNLQAEKLVKSTTTNGMRQMSNWVICYHFVVLTWTLQLLSTSLTYCVSLLGPICPGMIGNSNEIINGDENWKWAKVNENIPGVGIGRFPWNELTRTDARAFSTPSKLPHNETWLLFSVELFRFESGKWIWVIVSSMIFLILLPERPMMYEWSVYEMSIFMITRLPYGLRKR